MPLGTIATVAGSALGAGSQVIGLLKGAIATAKAAGKSELLAGPIDVQVAMLDLLQKHQDVLDENGMLKRQNDELKSQRVLASEVSQHYGAYWRKVGDAFDGPFSSREWENNGTLCYMKFGHRTHDEDRGPCYVFISNHADKHEYAYVSINFLQKHNVPVLAEVPVTPASRTVRSHRPFPD